MTNRKQSRQPHITGRIAGYANDNFVVPDDDGDEDYQDDDDEDDGFEPIREGGRMAPPPPPKRRVGQRITADATMDNLNEMHRFVVDAFVRDAKVIAERIQNDKFLYAVPFSDTVLRQMAINFTETEEEMLGIPGADPEKVRLYGRHFTKLIRDCRRQYTEMSGAAEDSRVLDPNLQNVIDLVSDDDEEADNYGPSINGSDMEDDEEGEASNYFQQDPRVAAFNQRFANSQLASNNSNAASASQAQTAGRKPAAKPRKQKWKARGSTSYAKRATSDGASRGAGSKASGRGGASSSKKAPKRSAASGAASKRGGGGGGFSMMPT